MTLEIKHQKVSAVSDSGDTNIVQPSDWNNTHNLEQAADRILGRVTAGAGATEELTAAQVKTLLAIDDGDVGAAASATNYTPSASTVNGHLGGVDTALRHATQAEAEAGTASSVLMTPERTKQAIDELVVIASSVTASGYIKLVGGVLIQWGTGAGSGSVSYPTAFPTAVFAAVATTNFADRVVNLTTVGATTMTASVTVASSGGSSAIGWRYIAIGH